MSRPVTIGFYGKLPARGDFVRAGLPRDFTDRWDDWLQSVIAGSRALMGEDWLPAFLESPVWRFALPPGMCGDQAALGLMLPSVDKAGRYFPLTFAALAAVGLDAMASAPWLDGCEAAGRAALEQDTPPQEISDMIGVPDLPDAVTEQPEGMWWSDGSPRVTAARMLLPSLPNVATYAAMLGGATQEPAATADACGRDSLGERTWEPPS